MKYVKKYVILYMIQRDMGFSEGEVLLAASFGNTCDPGWEYE